MKLRTLTLELKKLTDPINLGAGLGFPEHELAIIKRDNPQGLVCVCVQVYVLVPVCIFVCMWC